MKRNKVAIINSVYKYGSTGRICFEMASFFLDKGIETRVFYGRGKKAEYIGLISQVCRLI